MIDEITIRRHYDLLRPSLDERGRRLFAASQVRALGYGGLAAVARATGIAPSTIGRGLKELDQGDVASGRLRRAGGGRKRLTDIDATLESDLLALGTAESLGVQCWQGMTGRVFDRLGIKDGMGFAPGGDRGRGIEPKRRRAGDRPVR